MGDRTRHTIFFLLIVFLGGCCYGPSSSIIKTAYSAGINSRELVIAEFIIGLFILLIFSGGYYLKHYFKDSPSHIAHNVTHTHATIVPQIIKKRSDYRLYIDFLGSEAYGKGEDKPHEYKCGTDCGSGDNNFKCNCSADSNNSDKNVNDSDDYEDYDDSELEKIALWKKLLIIIASGLTIATACAMYLLSLNTIPASLAVLLLLQFTWMGVVLDCLLERRFPSKKTVIAVTILIIGTVCASGVLSGLVLSESGYIGVIYGLIGAAANSLFMHFSGLAGRCMKTVHPIYRASISLFFGLIFLMAIFGVPYVSEGFTFSVNILPFAILIGLFSCALPNLFFTIGTPHISTGASVILSSSELPASIICAVILIHEHVAVIQWVGIALVFFGIAYPYIRETGQD